MFGRPPGCLKHLPGFSSHTAMSSGIPDDSVPSDALLLMLEQSPTPLQTAALRRYLDLLRDSQEELGTLSQQHQNELRIARQAETGIHLGSSLRLNSCSTTCLYCGLSCTVVYRGEGNTGDYCSCFDSFSFFHIGRTTQTPWYNRTALHERRYRLVVSPPPPAQPLLYLLCSDRHVGR